MNLLTVSAVSKITNTNFVLNPVSFQQQQFEKVAIAGETGSGKSTLLKIIAGLIQPSSGEVLIQGEKVPGPEEKLLPGHPKIAYLSQHFELRNNYRVEELLEMTNKLSHENAAEIYKVCRIDHLLKRRTNEISGGEKQRIALAKQLVRSPQLLILDEPFSNLDMIHKQLMRNVITDIGTVLKLSCILVAHDPSDILSWADKVIVMKDGRFVQVGSPFEIYSKPVNEYAAALFGKYNLLNGGLLNLQVENDKQVLLRPEDMVIVNKEQSKFSGIVKTVSFYGSFCEVEVASADITIIIKTETINYKKGDELFISFEPQKIVFV